VFPFLFSYFFHFALSVTAKQSGCEPRRLCGVGDPTRACVQAPPDHGRGRSVPACRGGMGLYAWTRKWLTTRSVNDASDWQPALQPAGDILKFTLNITAFVQILINMFWTCKKFHQVDTINYIKLL